MNDHNRRIGAKTLSDEAGIKARRQATFYRARPLAGPASPEVAKPYRADLESSKRRVLREQKLAI
jgi:hypothetical protein